MNQNKRKLLFLPPGTKDGGGEAGLKIWLTPLKRHFER